MAVDVEAVGFVLASVEVTFPGFEGKMGLAAIMAGLAGGMGFVTEAASIF